MLGRLGRDHPAAQGSLPADHGAAGVQGPAVDRDQRRRRAHPRPLAQNGPDVGGALPGSHWPRSVPHGH